MRTILLHAPMISHRLASALDRNYCPAVEPYIAWLRQPVGWFLLATAASILVGLTVSPVGLSLAVGLLALLAVGLIYPFLATQMTSCELLSPLTELQEDEPLPVQVSIRNRCPWHLWGLMIEGFVVHPTGYASSLDDAQTGDIGLGCIPWLSRVTFRLQMRPRMRGRYPIRQPRLTCAFPFGVWVANRKLGGVAELAVRPKILPLIGLPEQAGRPTLTSGEGIRGGGHGDLVGLRDYRVGDSIRQIHWAHTARLDSIVVCERSSADTSTYEIRLSTRLQQKGDYAARDNLAWRVRIAASLCALLHKQSMHFELMIEGENPESVRYGIGNRLQQAMERLTDVPIDGPSEADAKWEEMAIANVSVISIEPVCFEDCGELREDHHRVRLIAKHCSSIARCGGATSETIIDLNMPIAAQVNAWLQRMNYARSAA